MYGVTVAGGVIGGSEAAGCAGRGCILSAQASLRGPGDDPVACLRGDDYQSLMQVRSVRPQLCSWAVGRQACGGKAHIREALPGEP